MEAASWLCCSIVLATFEECKVRCRALPRFDVVQGLPPTGAGSTPWLYGLVLLAMGLLTSWPGPVCNVVVFAEVVPEVRPGLLG